MAVGLVDERLRREQADQRLACAGIQDDGDVRHRPTAIPLAQRVALREPEIIDRGIGDTQRLEQGDRVCGPRRRLRRGYLAKVDWHRVLLLVRPQARVPPGGPLMPNSSRLATAGYGGSVYEGARSE